MQLLLTRLSNDKVSFQQGFTLIEMMVVIAIITILASIAYPSYQNFVRKNDIQKAKSVMMMQANELNRWRARQLNYAGFVPQNPTNDNTKYSIQTVTITGSGSSLAASSLDTVNVATNYVILAAPQKSGLPYIGLSSHGTQCESLDGTITAIKIFTDQNCGTGSATW